jgi:hypothetical protein
MRIKMRSKRLGCPAEFEPENTHGIASARPAKARRGYDDAVQSQGVAERVVETVMGGYGPIVTGAADGIDDFGIVVTAGVGEGGYLSTDSLTEFPARAGDFRD